MITLLMALFMVLFSISSVNISKYQTLQQSLKSAFSGSILTGGKAILQSGSESTSAHTPATAEVPAIVPLTPERPRRRKTRRRPRSPRPMMSASASQGRAGPTSSISRPSSTPTPTSHGFSSEVHATITRQGLDVRVLTDKLLFESGSATLQSGRRSTARSEVASLLKVEGDHPITVEGNTDNVPISSSSVPVQLGAVDRPGDHRGPLLHRAGRAGPSRLGAAGYAALHPVASNSTATGRALNRRVDIVLQRLYPDPTSQPALMTKKKLIIILAVVLVVGGVGAKMFVLPKKAAAKEKINGTLYVLPKAFTLNMADGKYATLTLALDLAPGQSTGAIRRRDDQPRRLRHPRRGAGHPRDRHQRAHQSAVQGADHRNRPHQDAHDHPQGDQASRPTSSSSSSTSQMWRSNNELRNSNSPACRITRPEPPSTAST